MDVEIEAKWIVSDWVGMRQRLMQVGAKLVAPERLMRRRPFAYPDNRLERIGAWVRVRDEGDKVTLSYKQLRDRSLTGTREVTVVVSDFERTCELLKAIGLEAKSYQETRRETWRLGECEVTLDTWPWIPPVVEIEAGDEATVQAGAAALGFVWAAALHGSIENVYQRYYDVTESEVTDWPEISFVPVPEWLKIKRRQLKD